MKSYDSPKNEIEYLPSEMIESFAKSYSLSFPEHKLNKSSLVAFLNRKFLKLEKTNTHNIAALVTDEGIVASGYGIIRNRYVWKNEAVNVGLVCDVFTNANFRKLGLFKKVSLLAIKREELTDTNFLIGFPIRDEVMPGHLSVGWKYIFDMPLWWSIPRLGTLRNVQKNNTLDSSMFSSPNSAITLDISNEFLNWRFNMLEAQYYFVTVPNSNDFAIVRKAKVKKLPFTCIVFMQSTNLKNTKYLVRRIRNLSFRLGTLGVLGCWNDSYANELHLPLSGLKKSSKFQKVIVRELNGFNCPNVESQYRLSWIDSDTL